MEVPGLAAVAWRRKGQTLSLVGSTPATCYAGSHRHAHPRHAHGLADHNLLCLCNANESDL